MAITTGKKVNQTRLRKYRWQSNASSLHSMLVKTILRLRFTADHVWNLRVGCERGQAFENENKGKIRMWKTVIQYSTLVMAARFNTLIT